MDFATQCETDLRNKQREGIEVYAPFLAEKMRECQKECVEKKFTHDELETRWKYLFQLTKGFDPRQRCFTEKELEHFPALLILKQQGKREEFDHYMLRFRIDAATGSEQEKTMLIHEIERKRQQENLF